MNDHKVLDKYPGAKYGSGMCQNIINHIRPHDVYMELYVGSGAVFLTKEECDKSILNDIDPDVVKEWRNKVFIDFGLFNVDAISFLSNYDFLTSNRYCIYLDPPYPFVSRRNKRNLYAFEMSDNDHIKLLDLVFGISYQNFNIDFLISTYPNDIYKKALQGWNYKDFEVMTRQGKAVERLYMNYNEVDSLHEYTYLGEGFTDRQRISRKIEREVKKLERLPVLERKAIISKLKSTFII